MITAFAKLARARSSLGPAVSSKSLRHRLGFRLVLGAVGILVGATFSACSTTQTARRDDLGPNYVPRNIAGPATWPGDIARVAVLPAADATAQLPVAFTSSYDPVWLYALQQSQRAEFVFVDRPTYRRWTGGPRAPTSTGLLPPDWAERIRATTGADAALLLDLTGCSPYPPLTLGLRAKLVRLTTGEVIWTADEWFDASNPDVARAARRHARGGLRSRKGEGITVLHSPTKFAAYAMDALTTALPPR